MGHKEEDSLSGELYDTSENDSQAERSKGKDCCEVPASICVAKLHKYRSVADKGLPFSVMVLYYGGGLSLYEPY